MGVDRRQILGGNSNEALLAGLPLTSCCAAWFLTGHGLVPAPAQGWGPLVSWVSREQVGE